MVSGWQGFSAIGPSHLYIIVLAEHLVQVRRLGSVQRMLLVMLPQVPAGTHTFQICGCPSCAASRTVASASEAAEASSSFLCIMLSFETLPTNA
jgi:hypothetical protein